MDREQGSWIGLLGVAGVTVFGMVNSGRLGGLETVAAVVLLVLMFCMPWGSGVRYRLGLAAVGGFVCLYGLVRLMNSEATAIITFAISAVLIFILISLEGLWAGTVKSWAPIDKP